MQRRQAVRGTGQGPPGGGALVYTHTHTDQENGLLTTLQAQWFTAGLGTGM
jgi:hypothetical protein